MSDAPRSNGSVGVRLRRWAERHCSPEVVDALVLPIVADLQYEDALDGQNVVTRWFIRVRAYAGLVRALGLHCATGGRLRMRESNSSRRPTLLDSARVVLIALAALVALVATQYLAEAGLADLMYLSGASRDTQMWAWNATNSWPGKAVGSALMGAALVTVLLWLFAPLARLITDRDRTAIRTAKIGLCAIAVLSVFVSVFGGPRAVVTGLAPWLGGGTAFWLARRARHRAKAVDEDRQAANDANERRRVVLDFLRLGVMVPAALIAATAAGLVALRVIAMLLVIGGVGRGWVNQNVYASAFWIASPFMAAAIVGTLFWIAPARFRRTSPKAQGLRPRA